MHLSEEDREFLNNRRKFFDYLLEIVESNGKKLDALYNIVENLTNEKK